MRSIPSQIAVVALAACALLSACGGGDDSGNSGGATSSQGGTPTPAPAPLPSPAPSPAPSPDPSPTPPRTGETLPSLSAPQPGSTAEVGNGSEGIWSEFGGATFVDTTGRFVRAERIGVVNGGFQFSGSNWSFAPDTIFEYLVPKNVTGSGTITLGSKLDGSYLKDGSDTPTTVRATYDAANALAVDQASIQGSWKQDGFEMSVDEQGNVNGTYTSGTRICALTGTAVLAEAGSRKNLYRLNMTATVSTQPASTGCNMSVGIPHLGYAAIRFMPSDGSLVITSSTLYSRTLAMVASSGNGGYFMTQMRKQ